MTVIMTVVMTHQDDDKSEDSVEEEPPKPVKEGKLGGKAVDGKKITGKLDAASDDDEFGKSAKPVRTSQRSVNRTQGGGWPLCRRGHHAQECRRNMQMAASLDCSWPARPSQCSHRWRRASIAVVKGDSCGLCIEL